MENAVPSLSVIVTERSMGPSSCVSPVISSIGFAAAGSSVVPAAALSSEELSASCAWMAAAACVLPSSVYSPVLANAGTLMVPALRIIADRIAISLIFFLMSYSSSSF